MSSPQDGGSANFTIEATLYDTTTWSGYQDNMDLESYSILHMEPKVLPSGYLGFHGYQLVGRLERPKLWSAEHVSSLNTENY